MMMKKTIPAIVTVFLVLAVLSFAQAERDGILSDKTDIVRDLRDASSDKSEEVKVIKGEVPEKHREIKKAKAEVKAKVQAKEDPQRTCKEVKKNKAKCIPKQKQHKVLKEHTKDYGQEKGKINIPADLSN